jgi:regulator of RNase E activity RraB
MIDHGVYFRTPTDRNAFALASVGAGFTVRSVSEHGADKADRRFFLNLVRTDPVTLEHIDRVVLQLLELARQYNADYDGWGCEVQAAGAPDDSPA